jgi:hypothetical protein
LLFEVSFNSRKYIPEDGTRTMPDMTKEEQQSEAGVSKGEPASCTGAEYTVRIQSFSVKLKGLTLLS